MAQRVSEAAGVHPGALVHREAAVDESAAIGEGAVVEAGAIVGPNVVIGARCRLRMRCIVERDTVLGEGNDVFPYAVLGGDPQDRAYDPETPGRLEVGDGNVFREHVTLHRSTEPGPPTLIGSGNYFMAYSHVGHNARVGDRNSIANATALAGHAHIGNDNVLSSSVGIHQFTTVGDLCMIRHGGGASMHVPPFVILGATNVLSGVNRVGLARNAGITEEGAAAVRRAFRTVFRAGHARGMLEVAGEGLERAETEAERRFYGFIVSMMHDDDERRRGRGIARHKAGAKHSGAGAKQSG